MTERVDTAERWTRGERRTLVKGVAWSLPVIAVAVCGSPARARAGFDLTTSFGSPLTLAGTAPTGRRVAAEVFRTLTIANDGGQASPRDARVLLTYDRSVLELRVAGDGVTVAGRAGSLLLSLPSIPACDALVIELRPRLLAPGILALGFGTHASTMTASVRAAEHPAGEASGRIDVTVLRPTKVATLRRGGAEGQNVGGVEGGAQVRETGPGLSRPGGGELSRVTKA